MRKCSVPGDILPYVYRTFLTMNNDFSGDESGLADIAMYKVLDTISFLYYWTNIRQTNTLAVTKHILSRTSSNKDT